MTAGRVKDGAMAERDAKIAEAEARLRSLSEAIRIMTDRAVRAHTDLRWACEALLMTGSSDIQAVLQSRAKARELLSRMEE